MISPPGSIWGELKDRWNNSAPILTFAGTPVNGTSGTGANLMGKGSIIIDITNGVLFQNTNTKASPTWVQLLIDTAGQIDATNLASSVLQQATGTISSANITGTSAGQFGHAAGVELLAAPGAGNIAELVSLAMMYDFATAAYTDGGNITVNRTGGSAITGLVSAANSVANAADKVAVFMPLAAAAEVVTPNIGFSLVSSAAFTQPGTAAGVIRWKLTYRVWPTGF